MRVRDIEAANASALAARREGRDEGVFRGFVDIEIPGIPPFVMFTNGDCSVAGLVMNDGGYEPTSLALWCALARGATGIIDIGAYTGIYALAAASVRPDLTVHAFEPNPFSLARLRLNRQANELWNIEERNWAIGDRHGQITLNWFRKKERTLSSTATVVPPPDIYRNHCEQAIVELHPIDQADLIGPRGLVKIDVEGAEVAVMAGLSSVLALKPDILIECFNPKACAVINAQIAPLGYSVFLIEESSGVLVPRPAMEPRDPKGSGMNQLLTAHPEGVRSMMKEA
jgi:FkbM family methyltransferase